MNILKLWLLSVIVVPFALGSGYLKTGLMSFSPSFDLAEDGKSLLTKIKNFQKQDLSDWQGVTIKDKVITYKDALGNVIVTIKLPFEYLRLSEKDINELYYVAQNRMTIIEGEERALVGPLYPCLGVFITLVNSSKTLVMHVDIRQESSNVIREIKNFIDKEKAKNSSSLKILVYMTEKTGELEDLQKDFFNCLVGSLNRVFGSCSEIKFTIAESVLNSEIFKNEIGFCLLAYPNAASTLVVTADGTCCNTCLITEPTKYLVEAVPVLGFTQQNYELIKRMAEHIASIAKIMLASVLCYSNKSLTKLGENIERQRKASETMAQLMRGEIPS